MRSIDNKAYLEPGTSEGFKSVRNKTILTTTAAEHMRKLPKHGWPVNSVYQDSIYTLSYICEGLEVDGREKIGSVGDCHYVFVMPKKYVDSSGSTWASETVNLRHKFPADCEVDEETNHSLVYGK